MVEKNKEAPRYERERKRARWRMIERGERGIGRERITAVLIQNVNLFFLMKHIAI